MIKLQSFQTYFTTYYVFGLNPFVSFSGVHKDLSPIMLILPRIVNILVNALIVYRLSLVLYEESKSVDLLLISWLCVNSGNCVPIFENWCNLHSAREILKSLSFIIESLEISLDIHFPYKVFEKSVKSKFLLQIMMVFVTSFVNNYLVGIVNGWSLEFGVLLVIPNLIRCVSSSHFIFYIEFMTFTLAKLNQKVVTIMNDRNISWCRGENKEWLHIFRQMKLIHFKLWKVSRDVNALFGWFFVAFIIDMSLLLTREPFRAFIVAADSDLHYTLIFRKYVYVFYCTIICCRVLHKLRIALELKHSQMIVCIILVVSVHR